MAPLAKLHPAQVAQTSESATSSRNNSLRDKVARAYRWLGAPDVGFPGADSDRADLAYPVERFTTNPSTNPPTAAYMSRETLVDGSRIGSNPAIRAIADKAIPPMIPSRIDPIRLPLRAQKSTDEAENAADDAHHEQRLDDFLGHDDLHHAASLEHDRPGPGSSNGLSPDLARRLRRRPCSVRSAGSSRPRIPSAAHE